MPRRPMAAAHVGSLMSELSAAALMQALPRRRVAQALRETGTESARRRRLPAVLIVYLVVILALYAEVSVRENLRVLLEPLRRKFGLDGTKVPVGSAITRARKRLGARPFRWLFDHHARPLGDPGLPGGFWRGFRVVAADATTANLQNTPENRERFGVHRNQHGPVGNPQLKAVLLVECGTRAPFGCAWGGGDEAEPAMFDALREKLTPDLLLLADRIYYSFERWQACARRAGALVWRVRNSLKLTPIQRFPDGSFLAEVRPSPKLVRRGLCRADERAVVRAIEYRPVFADGTEGETVRLITTLLDPEAYPAEDVAKLYPERWQIETGFDELKTHLRGPDRVLRSPRPDLVEQELCGFLLADYLVRATMAEAARRDPCAPRELSFVHAVRVLKRRIAFPPSEPSGGEGGV